jgi:hypothetical protein
MTPLTYSSGEDIRLGDRVSYSGDYGTVVFISDGDECEAAPGYEDYSGSEPGLMLCDDDGGTTFLGEPGERLEFVSRA